MDYKRCVKRWYWKWRKGYVPKAHSFGALELGTWMHEALALWYGRGTKRNGVLALHFVGIAEAAQFVAKQAGAPDHVLEKADELTALGEAMCYAYEARYGRDSDVDILGVEIPLEFTISNHTGVIIAVHKLKPDAVYVDKHGRVWLMEHKTAASISTEHLSIDDQARPYGAMSESALRKKGILKEGQSFAGIMYNFLRKGLPDERPVNAKGQALNQNGSVSKRQPAKSFLRHPVLLTRTAKVMTLHRVRQESVEIVRMADALREKVIDPLALPKTPHKSCPRTCPFFGPCVAEESGVDVRDMFEAMYVRQNPYAYGESTDELPGFEMG